MKLKSALKSGPAAKDPRFQKAIDRLDESAKRARTHEPASAKANQAQAAALPPGNEKLAGAQANKVEAMQEAKTGKPEPASFLEMLRGAIRKAMPTKTEDTEDFMEGDDRQKLKDSLAGSANEQTEASAGDLAAATNQTPDTGAVPGKEVAPLPSPPPPSAPPAVGAVGAMPEPKPEEEVSLAQGTNDINKKFSDEKITVPQLLKANDPRFTAAAQQKQSVEAYANTAPGRYRAAEKGILNQAVAAAKGDEQKGLAAFKGQGGKAAAGVKERQLTAKEKDEKARKDVADRIQAMFDATKARVDAKLAKLDEEVPRIFDAGTELAVMKMKDYVEKRFDERYSGISGKALWLSDKIGMLPPWVKAWFDQAQQLFLIEMDTLVVRVANLVEFRLKEAKDEIARGQKQISDYVASLPGNLRAVGLAAEREMQGRFDELREGVESKKSELAESLAQRYKEATDKGGAALQEMKDAHKGLIDKVADTLAEIAEALRKFREKVGAMLKKAEKTIDLIAADPIGFLGNLLDALKKGVGQFSDNIWTHLKNGFFAWLFGSLADAGIQAPPDFSPGSILKLVLQVLGLTYAKIRAKAVKLIGERNVGLIEKAAEILKALITGGPEKLWEMMKEYLSNLKETIADSVQEFIVTAIIKAAVTKLVSMFNPVGAIIQAILAIYNVVMFFVEKINQILAFVQSIIDSVYAIVMHQIDNAANAIEQALARTIPLIIGFLARLLGLSGITQKIVGIIKKIQDKVDKAVDKVIAKVVAGIGKLVGGVKAGVAKLVAWWKLRKIFQADGQEHALFFRGEKGSAELVVASEEAPVETFLKSKEEGAQGEKKKAITATRALLKEAEKLLAQSKGDETDDLLQKDIEKKMNEMAPYLMLLLSNEEWGTEANPAPLDYQKRQATAYPVFFLATADKNEALKNKNQKELASEWPNFKDQSLFRFAPTEMHSTPGGEEKLGLGSESQVAVGRKFLFEKEGDRGNKVPRFKEVVKKYGFNPNKEGLDVDHVIELQIGGTDEFPNLWPLPSGENRSSGVLIKDAKTKVPDEGEITVDAAFEKKKEKGGLWLMIATTRQR